MVCNIASFITPAIVWSSVTAIPIIEPAIHIILNVGFLVSNRCQYYHAKVAFKPTQAFTDSEGYESVSLPFDKKDIKHSRKEIIKLMKSDFENDPVAFEKNLTLRLENSNKTHSTNIGTFKNFSAIYRKLSRDFLELRQIKDLDTINQIQEFIIPSSFSEKSFNLLADYLNSYELDVNNLDQAALFEMNELAAYLRIDILEAETLLPILKDIRDNGKTDLGELKNNVSFDRYKNMFEVFFNEINAFKDEYYKSTLDQKLSDLQDQKWEIIKEISINVLLTAWLSLLPLCPAISPAALSFLNSIPPEVLSLLTYYLSSTFTLLTPVGLIVDNEKIIPTTKIILKTLLDAFSATVETIIAISTFLVQKTAEAILFTAKTVAHASIFTAKTLVNGTIYIAIKTIETLHVVASKTGKTFEFNSKPIIINPI